MGDKSKIDWTDASWTPIRARYWQNLGNEGGKERIGWHCERVSDACRNCYAEGMNLRLGTGMEFKPSHRRREVIIGGPRAGEEWRPGTGIEPYHEPRGDVELFLDENTLTQPLRWKRPRKIFVCSMTDLFADFVPDKWIDLIFAVMVYCPQHTFQILTKRSRRMREYCLSPDRPDALFNAAVDSNLAEVVGEGSFDFKWPLPNVWLGVTAEDQPRADEQIPDLLETPAARRFVSIEPMLGPVYLRKWLRGCYECAAECGWRSGDAPPREICHSCGMTSEKFGEFCECGAQDFGAVCPQCESNAVTEHPDTPTLDWVIAGGESGPRARPSHPDWFRSLRDQCAAAGVPYFFKQWGEWAPGDAFGLVTDDPIADRLGNVKDWTKRYVTSEDRGDRVAAHSFTNHATDLVYRVGKRRAGHLLDGREHREFPNG